MSRVRTTIKATLSTNEVEDLIQKDISRLQSDGKNMSVDEFLALKNHILGKVEIVSDLKIVTEDKVSRFLQHLDSIRYF